MADTIEEIVVRGKRRKGPGGFATFTPGRRGSFGDSLDIEEMKRDRAEDEQERKEAEESDDDSETIEEIVVTAAPVAVATRLPPGMTRAEFNLGKARAASLERAFGAMNRQAIEEITVTAKRAAPRVRSLLPFGGPLIFGADIFAQIVDRLSQQRLDELGRIATRTVKPKPDTPVATIEPEVIPEIVVRAKRPLPKVLPLPTVTRRQIREFGDPRVSFPKQTPTAVPQTVAPPKAPPRQKPKLINFLLDDPVSRLSPTPKNVPRSTLLNIPRRIPGQPVPTTTPGDLTGVGTRVLPLSQTQPVVTSRCPPCPKPRKKNRLTCYKRLVKEKTNPRNDKSFKLVQINCRSGKEIPKRKGKS